MFPDKAYVDQIKEQYPAGTRIILDHMGDDPRPIPPGTNGVVLCVDDIGTVHCEFENGRKLGLIPGEDAFHTSEVQPLEELLGSVDLSRDVFYIDKENQEVVEVYYNPDSISGGQFVFNTSTFCQTLEAEKIAEGNTEIFFDYLNEHCLQEPVDIDDAFCLIEDAAYDLMGNADYSGLTKDTMKGLITAAHAALDRQPQKHKAEQAR